MWTIHSILEKWVKPRINLQSNYIELIDKSDEIKIIRKCKKEFKKDLNSEQLLKKDQRAKTKQTASMRRNRRISIRKLQKNNVHKRKT